MQPPQSIKWRYRFFLKPLYIISFYLKGKNHCQKIKRIFSLRYDALLTIIAGSILFIFSCLTNLSFSRSFELVELSAIFLGHDHSLLHTIQ
jgi:hypothetical protein